jgi:enterochelin esterase-like enzyme
MIVLLTLWAAGCRAGRPVSTEIPALSHEPSATRTPIVLPLASSPTYPPPSMPVSSPTPTSTPMCAESSGHTDNITYSSFVLEGEIPVTVYLPPCYKFTEEPYPVLYVLHGYPMDETHWETLGIRQIAETGIERGSWKPFIIVMPRIPDPLNTHSDGGPGSYEEEFLSALLPTIEQEYRVLRTEQGRAIAGVSRGGVWALEIGLRNADVFNTVAALSPALHVNNPRPAYNPFNLIQNVDQLPENIFLSAAEDEGGFRTKTEELSHRMEELGIPHTYLLTDGLHEDSTWMGIMDELITFITASWEREIL